MAIDVQADRSGHKGTLAHQCLELVGRALDDIIGGAAGNSPSQAFRRHSRPAEHNIHIITRGLFENVHHDIGGGGPMQRYTPDALMLRWALSMRGRLRPPCFAEVPDASVPDGRNFQRLRSQALEKRCGQTMLFSSCYPVFDRFDYLPTGASRNGSKRLSLDGADCDALYHKPGHKGIKATMGMMDSVTAARDHAFGSDIGHVVVAGDFE